MLPAAERSAPGGYTHTLIVSPDPDRFVAGRQLMEAVAGITDASAGNPYLVKIEPGVYDLDGSSLAMRPYVDIEGSGPREPGAAMAVSSEGEVVGSVSGGCVEGAVVTEALSVLSGERPPGVVTFGYSDDEAFAVGLTCGGTIRLFIEELDW